MLRSVLRGISFATSKPSRCLFLSLRSTHYDITRKPTSQADNMMDIGTRPIFTADQDIFRQSVRKWFQEEALPHLEKHEKQGDVGRELWQKAGEQGFLGINVPEDCGGMGGSYLDSCIVSEE
ncbi:unnamed protein product, partial [Notodromas monacha]